MSNFLKFAGNSGVTFKNHGTGGGTSFTLDKSASTNSVLLSIGGIIQKPVTDYSISGTAITTTSSVTSGVEVFSLIIHDAGNAPVIEDNSVTGAKIALGSDAQGDVMYYNGSDWARLAAGTSGHFLKTQGTGANPAWAEAGGGKVLQVVSTTKTDTFSTTSDSFTDVTGLTVSITPAATSSKVLVIASVVWTNVGGTSHNFYGRLMRDSTALHVGTGSIGSRVAASFGGDSVGVNSRNTSSINFLDSPSSTSAIAYHIEARSQTSGQAVYVNRSATDTDGLPYSRLASTVTAMEIGA